MKAKMRCCRRMKMVLGCDESIRGIRKKIVEREQKRNYKKGKVERSTKEKKGGRKQIEENIVHMGVC